YYAAVFKDGQVIDLNTLITVTGATLSAARGTNSAGQIVGNAFVGGVEHGFLLTPATAEDEILDVRHLVEELVRVGVLLPANGQSLYSKLDAAVAKASNGDKAGAITDLKAFINQVTTFVKTGRLS